jgi:NEDD4-binding protein 2
LRNAFPLVDSEVLDATFVAHHFSFSAARAHLAELFPGSLVEHPSARPQPVPTPWAAQSQHHSKVATTSAADAARGIITEQRVAAEQRNKQGGGAAYDLPDGIEEASGGLSDAALEAMLGPLLDGKGGVGAAAAAPSSVDGASSEHSLRALADVHSARRRAYFGAAASAFSRGQGAVASQLASRGRAERAELQRAQSAAVLATFVAHNNNAAAAGRLRVEGGGGGSGTTTLDFHGLRVAEALRVLAFVLARQRRRLASGSGNGSNTLHLVTGVGNHSQGGRARLQPALLDYLRRQQVHCNTTTPGVIQVHLTP